MGSSQRKDSRRQRFLLESYAACFVALGVSLFADPVASPTDAYGLSLGSIRARAVGPTHVLTGLASYYHPSLNGELTSSREPYDGTRYTAAHRTLPLGTVVRVFNEANGKHVDVVVNDRGPYVAGRVIDLSSRAARELGIVEDGLAPVRLRVLRRAEPRAQL